MKKIGIYIHIPFCVKKCDYCDFLSFQNTTASLKDRYMKALGGELDAYAAGSISAGGERIDIREYEADTVFFGGGTPSLIAPELLCRMMDHIRKCFQLSPDAEISLEANPGTLSLENLIQYRQAGFNRVSLGIQSFDDRMLHILGRIHTAADADVAFGQAREAGFSNINIDLMFGIPGQTMECWMDSLSHALALNPEHISFYSLKFEEGTPFHDMLEKGILREVDDSLDRSMYHKAVETMQGSGPAGYTPPYIHYEISNASRPGFACRHNMKYWSMGEYLGLGLGAHSYMNRERFSNLCDIEAYISAESGRIAWRYRNTTDDEVSEFIFTGLRKIDGISLKDYMERFGEPIQKRFALEISELAARGLVEIDSGSLRLTLQGIDISNTVLARFV